MTRRIREGEIVLPGALLGVLNDDHDDDGKLASVESTEARAQGIRVDSTTRQVRATVLGTVKDSPSSVAPVKTSSSFLVAPRPGSTVLFRVTKVQNIGAGGPIVAIDGKWCAPTFRGFVRLDDIRSVTAKEAAAGLVPTHAADSYRLGDLVCANVISLTEARQFQLTTQAPHCGLVKVYSERPTDGEFTPTGRRDQIKVEGEDGTRVIPRWTSSAAATATSSGAN